MASQQLTIHQGDSDEITFTVTNADGSAFDLTGYAMTMTVKEKVTDADVDAKVQKTAVISSPTTGIGVVSLAFTDTAFTAGSYIYDLQIFNSSTGDKKTVITDKFLLLSDVTD